MADDESRPILVIIVNMYTLHLRISQDKMNVASSKVSIYGQHHREPCAQLAVLAVLCDVHIIAVTTRTFQTAFATHQKKKEKI